MKPEGECFDATWRARAALRPCSIRDVEAFVTAHYLGRRPGVVTLVLRIDIDDVPKGMIVFALPPRETHRRYGGLTWELARLYLVDALPKNAETWVIGAALRYIKRTRPDVLYIVSYADPSVNHDGTIYKAANFKQDGRTDDERKTPRFDYVDAETGKHYSRKSHVGDRPVVRRARISKFRYVMSLVRPTPRTDS